MGVCSGPISAIVWGKRGRVAFPWAGQAYDRTDDISLQADSTPSHQSMAIHLKKFLYACRMLLRISLIPHFLVAVPFFSLLLRLEASTDSSKPHLVRTPTRRSRLAGFFFKGARTLRSLILIEFHTTNYLTMARLFLPQVEDSCI